MDSDKAGFEAQEVKAFILGRFKDELRFRGLDPSQVSDAFDLLGEGIVDSFGLMELIVALGEEAGFEIDFEGLDAEELTIIGPLTRYVANAIRERQKAGTI